MRIAALGTHLAALGPARPRGHATLLLPPTRPGSVGDEAMMTVCMERLVSDGRSFAIVDFVAGDRWPGEPRGTRHVDLSGFFGSAYVRSLPRLISVLRGFDRFWCLGADVMDGHYSEVGSLRRVALAHVAAELGLETSILGFSFNDDPSELVVDALRRLPGSVELFARDPVSHRRLLERVGRPVRLAADLAFGLHPAVELEAGEGALLEWMQARRGEGRRLVALNVSRRAFTSAGALDLDAAIDAYASGVSTLLRKRADLAFVCVPHDYRTHATDTNDLDVLRAIAGRIDPTVGERVLLPSERLRAPVVKRIVGEVDAVLSGRMHLAIAALGQGTPAATLSYQGKLAGLYQYFGLPELEVDPSEALTSPGVVSVLERLLDDGPRQSAFIEKALPEVRALSRSNFERCAEPGLRPRLLVVSPEATHPPNKGNRARILDLCRRAEELGWEVHLGHVERGQTERTLMYSHWGVRYHPLPYAYPLRLDQRLARRVHGIVTGRYDFRIDDWYDPRMDAHLAALHRRYQFRAVMVEYAHQSKAFDVFDGGVLKILDTHDELAGRFSRQEAFGQQRVGFSTTPSEESIGFARADVVLAIQDVERTRFESRTPRKVVTVGHRVPLVAPREKELEGRLLFLGSANQANVDGLRYFMRDVWADVSDRAKLLVAGPVCDHVDLPPEVERMPIVADVADAYDAADIVIVPIRFGTGLKIKTIEALGRGKPTVSTSVGAEGLEGAHGSALYIADDAAAFSTAILELLGDGARRRALSEAALGFVKSWNTRCEDAFAAVLSMAPGSQAAD